MCFFARLTKKGKMEKLFRKAFLCIVFALSAAFAAQTVQPLKIWIMPNGVAPSETLASILTDFTKKTNIPVEIEVLDWGEAWNKISLTLKHGSDLPDVVQLGSTWVPYFAIRGEIKPLNELLGKIDSTQFTPVSWQSAHIDADTVIYSIPWFMDVRALLANKRLMKKNGISKEDVATYEGFKKAIRKINDSKETQEDGTKIRGYSFPGKSDWNIPHNFAPWVWGFGGDFIQKDSAGNWHANILSKETLLGISKYLAFVLDTLVSTDALQTNTTQIAQQFDNGELGFIVNTSEIGMQLRFSGEEGGLSGAPIAKDSLCILPIPRGSVGSTCFIGGSNLAIPSRSNRPEAIKLLLYLTGDKAADTYTKQIGFLPASQKVLEQWAQDDIYKDLVKAVETGRAYTPIPEWGDIEQTLVSMFTAIWDQVETPALYSEEKLYQILLQYTQEINVRLNYKANDIMTYEQFKDVWKQSLGSPNSANTEQMKEATSKDHIKSNLRIAPVIFILILFISFLRTYKRKRKK